MASIRPSWLNHPIVVEEISRLMLCRRQCVPSLCRPFAARLQHGFVRLTRPSTCPLMVDTAADLTRSKRAVIADNALLRQQLLVLRQQVARPQLSPLDRFRLVVLAALTSGWQQTLRLVHPETLLRWHREGVRLVWKPKSRSPRRSRIPEETIILIRQMAVENPLWGAERIRGELLKLGIQVRRRTVQKSMRSVQPRQPTGQTWSRFLHNHTPDIWACDFLQVIDLWFRSLFAFFIIDLGCPGYFAHPATNHAE